MALSDYKELLDIPYLKLHFIAEVVEDCIMPKNKVSALRGGTGQMMIKQNCVLPQMSEIHDSDCEKCDCRSECLVQRFLYTPSDIQPVFSSEKLSMGYVFECEDYREEFSEGDSFQFNVILFGKSRVYVNLLFQALWGLGMAGLGKHKGRFFLREITNSKKEPVFYETEGGSQIIKERLKPENIYDYVRYRRNYIMRSLECSEDDLDDLKVLIRFQTETALKYQKKVMEEFDAGAIVSNLGRRLYMFNCFMGREMDYYAFNRHLEEIFPDLIDQEIRRIQSKRYSTRQQSSMPITGIIGKVILSDVCEEALYYLLAGEVLHIGRNTSFGCGRYRVLEVGF